MNEKIIEKLIQYLERTEDFLLEECPEILQQALKYHYISSIIGLIFCILGITILCVVFYYFYFYPKLDKYENRDLISMFGIFFPPLICLALVGIGMECANVLIKISIAPKYFLLSLLK